MAYEKQNFKDGQVLKAEHLNKIEAWLTMAQPPREEVVEGYILPETTITGADGQMMITDEFHMQDGQTYIVKWNGTEYTCTCVTLEVGTYVIGNIGAMSGGDSTGEPFVIVGGDEEIEAGVYGMVIALDGSAEATVSIFGKSVKIYPLEEKYLPEIPMLNLVELGMSTISSEESVITLDDFSVFELAFKKGVIRVKAELEIGTVNTVGFVGISDGSYKITLPSWDATNLYIVCIIAYPTDKEVIATTKTLSFA